MAVREGMIQPFDAGTWLDLRIGFLMSICGSADPASDDVITGLGETITSSPIMEPSNAYYIGLKTPDSNLPLTGGTVFAGFTNITGLNERGDSAVVTSDLGIGTTNADYWRPKNSLSDTSQCGHVFDGVQSLGAWSNGTQQHFVQNFSGGHAAGYATMFLFQLTRPNSTSRSVTIRTKQGTNSGDVLFTSTPTKALLQSNMESFPGTVQQIGPVTLSSVPNSLFWYWPWHNSRLRIHCAGIEVIA